MTALYFETEDEQQLDTAIFDSGDGILEDVKFITKIVNGKLKVSIHPEDEDYFSTLNTEYWLKKITDYVQDYAVFTHPENGEDVYLVTDEPVQSLNCVVGKAYSWEEVLQKAKQQQDRTLEEKEDCLNSSIGEKMNKVGQEFYVIMQKRRDGVVYCQLEKTNERIYTLKEDAEDDLKDYPYHHIVKLVAYLDNEGT